MRKLSNVKIGKRLTVVFGSIAVLVVCLTVTAIWSVHSLDIAMQAAETEGRMATLTEELSADYASVCMNVGHILISQRYSVENEVRIAALRKAYLAALDELKSLSITDEGRRRLDRMDKAVARVRDVNVRVIQLAKAARFSQAADTYRTEVATRAAETDASVAEYMNFRREELQAINKATQDRVSWCVMVLAGVGLACLLLAAIFGILITRSIVRPLAVAVSHLDHIAQGDVSRDMPGEYLTRADEIGLLTRAMQTMSNSLRETINNISMGVQVLASSSGELASHAGRMSDGSRRASDKAHSVAAAGEEMTANVASVASGMQQTNDNLSGVASATEEMTATIGDIASNSERARQITEDANRQAARISEQMVQLGAAAQQIGTVTETITEISAQTNLLALNATIEAARAGSAGKGFAVVANEIKQLAQQTAAATEDIKGRIASVQSSTAGGMAEIEKVSQVIREVNEIVSSIAGAIEEQSSVTSAIARSLSEALTGVREASARVSESSQATAEIARDIVGVDQAAGQMTEGSDHVKGSAAQLSQVADQLGATVRRFKI